MFFFSRTTKENPSARAAEKEDPTNRQGILHYFSQAIYVGELFIKNSKTYSPENEYHLNS
jgi:hypothetical protein